MSEDANHERMEGEAPSPKSARKWLDRLAHYKKTFGKWHDQCQNVEKLYSRHERADTADREYAIFWANIEVLRPATYARTPAPVVAPRFKDSNPVAREASEMLERSLVVTFEQSDLDGLMREVRDQFLKYSRGAAWVRLAKTPDAMGGESLSLAYDFVTFTDYAHGECKNWREVPWVARRAWMTEDAGEERFGEAFEGVKVRKRDPNAAIPDREDKAPVWEIWCKESRKVYWVAEDHELILDEQDPFLDLTGFFPCPRPAYGTLVGDTLLPVPEIRQYKDQIEEINEYTARISALSQALRMRGFYPAGAGDLSEAVEAAMKSQDDRAILVPISSVAGLGTGGFKDSVVWLPIADVAILVKQLVELRRVVIEDVYQITGISDIVRGQSEAQETLGAQQLKSQWGSMRIRERQNELVRFARDVTRISAEIIAENFDPATISEMSQVRLPSAEQLMRAQQMAQAAQQQGQPIPRELSTMLKKPSFEDVAAFLQNDRARGFVIEIETDSTIQPDEDADKQRRVEFVTSVGGLFQQAAPLVMQAPMLGPFVVEVMKFAASGFRAGRPLEMALDGLAETIEGMAEQSQQPQEPPPEDPAIALKRAEMEMKQQESEQKLSFEQQKHAQQMEFEQQKHAQEMSAKQDMALADRESKREIEFARINDQREGREATLKASEKPAVMVQTDAQGAMDSAAQTLQQMAVEQSDAIQIAAQSMQEQSAVMSEAIQALAAALEKMSAPKRVIRDEAGRAVGVESVQ